ncbi:conjugal transfer protein [Candidatus Parcubacteria bacterium]|nr:conjugal transfer protein [Candidatus Parcubacteria bacterium]
MRKQVHSTQTSPICDPSVQWRIKHPRLRKVLLWLIPAFLGLPLLAFAFTGVVATLRGPVALAGSGDQPQLSEEAARMAKAEECVASYLNFDSQYDRNRYDQAVFADCQPGEAYGRQFGWDGEGSEIATNVSSSVLPGDGPERDVIASIMVNGYKRYCLQVSTFAQAVDGKIKVGINKPPRLVPCPRVSTLVRPEPFTADPQLSELIKTNMQTFFTAFAGNDCPSDRAQLASLMANGRPIEGLDGKVRLGGIVEIRAEASKEATAGQEGDHRRAEVTVMWRDSDAAEAGMIQTYHLILVKRGPHWLVERLDESPTAIELTGCES